MIERSNFIGVLNAKRPTMPHLEANMAIIIEGETSENKTSPKQPICVFPSFTGNVREDAIAKLVWTRIGFSMTSVRAKYCCEIEINKSFSDPLLN